MKVLEGAIGVILRGGSAGAKFLFVIYLASRTSSALLGQVALLMTITTVFAQVAGLEINQVIGRQLHSLSVRDRWRLQRRQAQASMVAYFVLVPAAVLVYADLLASHWILACGILVLEHFLVEVYRFNILMLRTVYASSLLFIKNVGWMLVFAILVETGLATPSLSLVLFCWFGVLTASAVRLMMTRHAWWTLRDLLAWSTWPAESGKLIWQARTFIVSAFANAGIGAIDKLLIAGHFSAADLGVYFFFATCASIVPLIASFTIGATVGPHCIKVYAMQGSNAYLPHWHRLKRLYWLTAVVTTAVIILPANFLLTHFGKAEYQSQMTILYCLLPGAALVVLCEPYKLNAYLERKDRVLLAGNIFHLFAVAFSVAAFSIEGEVVAISMGVLLSSLLIYIYFSLSIWKRIPLLNEK